VGFSEAATFGIKLTAVDELCAMGVVDVGDVPHGEQNLLAHHDRRLHISGSLAPERASQMRDGHFLTRHTDEADGCLIHGQPLRQVGHGACHQWGCRSARRRKQALSGCRGR